MRGILRQSVADSLSQQRNRLVAEPFLVAAHRALRRERSLLSIKTDHPGYYQWMLGLFGMPTSDWLKPTPALAKSPARVRLRDLLKASDLPSASRATIDRFELAANSTDYWNDPSARAYTAQRQFAGETTPYEARFRRKRFPIYYIELRPRDAGGKGVMPGGEKSV